MDGSGFTYYTHQCFPPVLGPSYGTVNQTLRQIAKVLNMCHCKWSGPRRKWTAPPLHCFITARVMKQKCETKCTGGKSLVQCQKWLFYYYHHT